MDEVEHLFEEAIDEINERFLDGLWLEDTDPDNLQ